MEIHLKINDVLGMDEQKRHILHVDNQSLYEAIQHKESWIKEYIIKDFLLKKNLPLFAQLLDDPELRKNIYYQERDRREAKKRAKQAKKVILRPIKGTEELKQVNCISQSK